MTFTYTRETKRYYDFERDEVYYDEYDFDYTPEDDEVLDALADILVGQQITYKLGNKMPDEDYKLTMKVVKDIIKDQDWQGDMEEQFEEELKEYFKDQALDSECYD